MSGFLDTSIIVRYFMEDSPALTKQAAALIDSDEELSVTTVVLAEAAFVLTRFYRVERSLVVDYLIDLLNKVNIYSFGIDKAIVIEALLLCRPSGRVSFADALLWATARSSNQNVVYSFDRTFPREGVGVKAAL
jgi:predicted nucleic acid-binding protein